MSPQHDFNRVAGARLLKLVLALYRSQLVEMPDAGHTEDILLLLRLANGDSELMSWASSITDAESSELRKSCVAFIERICFSGDTNPFNVLGLNPWANADAVREHYRLLIRIFHPDRGQVSNQTAEAYSARINQAYAALKNQIGDDGPNLTERARTNYHGQSGIIPRRFTRQVNVQNNGGDTMRWATGLTPAKVLLGFALLAGLIIYLLFPHKMRMQYKAVNVVEKPEVVIPDAGLIPVADLAMFEIKAFPDVAIKHDSSETTPGEESNTVVVPTQPVMEIKSAKTEHVSTLAGNLIKVAPAATVNDKKVPADAAKADTKAQPVKTVAAKPLEAKQVEVKSAEVKLAEAKPGELKPDNKTVVVQTAVATAPSTAVQSPAGVSVNKKPSANVAENVVAIVSEIPVQARIVKPKPVNILSDRELHEVINGFMTHYSNGDINAFIQAFDDQVRSDEGSGKPDLYRAYADLFAKTALRTIVLKDLNWEKHGPLAIAHADYRASIQRAGETQITSSSGKLQIEVIKSDGRAVISGFFYQNEKK